MANVSSLWVGGPLTKVQEISLASFVHYGHSVKLYVYDLDLQVPAGIVKCDAREILDENKIFTHHGQLAAFADLFRYCMIKQTGEMWVDADTLCLSEYFFEDKDLVFIRQTKSSDWERFSNGILKIPSNHIMLDRLILEAEDKIANGLNEWGSLGPIPLTKLVYEYGLERFSVSDGLVNLFTVYTDAVKFWDPNFKQDILKKSNMAYSATFFNGGLTMLGIDKNNIAPGSAIEYFHNKFIK